MEVTERDRLRTVSRKVRESILETVWKAGAGHLGGSLSQVEVLVALYFRALRIDPTRPDWPERDRFVLSKGHGGLGLACVLAERGFLPQAELQEFGKTGHRLGMHLDHTKVPGVEVSTGSLGHGLGVAVGMALGAKLQRLPWRTFCLLSDGELYEGSTWEAAMAAGGFGLTRLTLIVDRNRRTMDGDTEALLPLEPIAGKLAAFGWRAREIDGHDLEAIASSLEEPEDLRRPTAIIAQTIKGKGVDFMEGESRWHYGALDSADHARALASLGRGT